MSPDRPFRIGSTSYVYQADILPNVRQLAPLVDDVELVLFEVETQSNLPSTAVVAELAALAAHNALTYTVHLPLDLRLATQDRTRRHPSIDKAARVIEAMRPLAPWAYVVHLDGAEIAPDIGTGALTRWREEAADSLRLISERAGRPQALAVENLESYSPTAFLPVVEGLDVSLCVDVGHLLKAGQDSVSYLEANLARTRVVHLHGLEDGHDHRGLDCLPDGLLGQLVDVLLRGGFEGVVTIEVFSEEHFFPGRDMVLTLLESRR